MFKLERKLKEFLSLYNYRLQIYDDESVSLIDGYGNRQGSFNTAAELRSHVNANFHRKLSFNVTSSLDPDKILNHIKKLDGVLKVEEQ